MSSGVPRRPLNFASRPKACEHPGAEDALLQVPGLGVAAGDERRRHAEAEPEAPLELRRHLGLKAAVGIEPGNLVLVLVGEQLVIGAGDCLGEALAARRPCALGLARAGHQGAVAGGKRRVLIGPQIRRAALDHRIEPRRLWRLGHAAGLGHRCGDRLRIVGGGTAPAEGAHVGFDRNAVERDRLLHRLRTEWNLALLVGKAQQEQVGVDGIADQRGRHAGRIDHVERPRRLAHHPLQLGRGEVEVRRAGEVPRRDRAAVEHGVRAAAVEPRGRLGARRHHRVDRQQQPGAAHGDPHRVQVLRPLRDADVAGDRAVFLGEARLVEHRGPLAFQPRRRAEQRGQRDDPGAAHACQQDAVGLGTRGARGLRQGCDGSVGGRRLGLAPLPALHQHEARAKALDAGEILVAGRLIDRPLAPELGLQRHHREAVRLHAAVAAALAHVRVDDDAPVRVLQRAALAPPPLLGRAHLVVDDGGDPFPLAQVALHAVELVPVVDGHAVRELPVEGVFLRLVGDHGDAAHTFRLDLPGHALDRERPVHGLAAGHRHGVVVEDLVGHVDAGGDGGPDRERAGVEVGAVADVLEDVAGLGEGRLADPVGALAPHVGVGVGLPVHPLRHVVAADAGVGAAPLRHLGGRVVRAARAEVGHALHRRRLGGGALRPAGLQPGDPRLQPLVPAEARKPLRQRPRDAAGVQLAGRAEERPPLLVALADDAGARARGQVVEQLLDLALDEVPLLLHHEDLVEPAGEAPDALGLQRPAHADLVERDAEPPCRSLVDAEVVERLAHVEVGLAGGHDAEPPPRPVDHGAVEPVRAGIGAGRVELVLQQPLLHLERRVRPADVEPAFGQRVVLGRRDGDPVRVHRDDGGAVHGLGDADEADPEPGVAREPPAVQPVIQEFLDARRVDHRHGGAREVELALVRGRRRRADVVVARQREHAAVGRRAGEVGVLEDVHRAVDARPLAVPDGEDAVVLRTGEEPHLLGAPERGRRRVLVHARLEVHAVLLDELLGLPERAVEVAERRAAVARDHAGGIQPCRLVAQVLHHRQPDQRLGSGHVDLARPGGVLVVECDRGKRHRYSCPQRPALLGARPQAAAEDCTAAPPSYPMPPHPREAATYLVFLRVEFFGQTSRDTPRQGETKRDGGGRGAKGRHRAGPSAGLMRSPRSSSPAGRRSTARFRLT